MISLLLADDHTLVREGICELLRGFGDFQITREAVDGEEARAAVLELARSRSIDVALLDVRMPKLNGVEVLEALRKAGERLPVILLTTFDDHALLRRAMAAGVQGFLLKDVSRQKLAEAIRTVAAGGSLIRPTVTERATRSVSERAGGFQAAENPEPLTKRELAVLRLIASGLSNGEIADRLGSAEGTVKNHTSHIFSKLGVRDRTQAVLRALELGHL